MTAPSPTRTKTAAPIERSTAPAEQDIVAPTPKVPAAPAKRRSAARAKRSTAAPAEQSIAAPAGRIVAAPTERSIEELDRLEAEFGPSRDVDRGARRANVLLVVVAFVVAGAVAGALFGLLPREYSSETKVLIEPAVGDAATTTSGSSLIETQMDTWAALAATPDVVQPALKAVRDSRLASDAKDAVSISIPAGTTIVTIDTAETDPQRAAALAYQVGIILIQRVESSSTTPATDDAPATSRVSARIVAPAVVPAAPSSPNPIALFGGALVAALAVAFLAITVRGALRRRADLSV